MLHHHSSHLLALTKWAPLAVAILVTGLAPGYAASPPGILIGSGQVTGGASPALSEQADSVSLQYSLYLQPDGMPIGNATLTSAAGSVDFDLSSYTISPEGTLSAAGPATAVIGSPAFGPDSEGPTPHVVELGETLFFSALDNRDLDVPDAFIEGKVPSFLPPEAIEQSRTILEILAAIPPAPASIFRQVTTGDLSIANPPGTLLGSGQVTGGASPALADQAASISLQYSLYLQPDGMPSGNATLTSAAGSVVFDLTSYTVGSDGRVSAAGPATKVIGSPAFGPDSEGPTPHVVEVGETLFFSVLDNPGLGAPDAFIEGKVPSFLPPEAIAQSRTILDIQAAIGTAPASIFRQVTAGDLSLSNPPGTFIASGQVTGGASPALSEQADSVSLQYSLYLQPDGTPSGKATLSSAAGSVDFDLSSYTISSDGTLSAAGPATAVIGSPAFGPDSEGPTPHVVELGETLFFSALDNRDLDVPDAFIEGKVPSFLPPETIAQSRTILDIQAAIGTAPASIFRQVTNGDLITSIPFGTLIGSGQVTGGASPALSEQADSVSLQYALYLQPDGSTRGNATLTSAAGSVNFDLSSYTISPDGTLSAAGPATAVIGSPAFGPDSEGPTPHVVELGETLFFSALDNRNIDVPDAFIEGKVPSFLPPEVIEQSRTILEILAAIPPAPASIFRQVMTGDLSIATPPGTLIGSGKATGGASPALADQAASMSLQYSLYLQPDGTPRGDATLTSAAGSVVFDLTSYTVGADGRVSAAGPATKVIGSPAFGPDSEGPAPHVVEVGETLFFSVLDNPGLGAPDAFIEGKVPSFLPPEAIAQSRTILDIQAAIGTAPASIFRKVTTGDLSMSNPPGTLIGSGQVTGGASPALADQAVSVSLQYSLYLQPDGTTSGNATLTSAAGSVAFDLSSYTISPDGTLSAAGPATAVIGSPAFGPDSEGPTPHVVELGETLFFSALDNRDLDAPDAFIEGKVPSFLPPEVIEQSRTILEILAAIPPAPASIFRQVTTGDLIKFAAKRASATSQVEKGLVTEIEITDGGSGYDSAPVVLIAGDGSGATAIATVTNGVVTEITVTDSGSGYTSLPQVSIASSPFASELAIKFIVSELTTEVDKVRVSLKVVLGQNYQLESSDDLNTWLAEGEPFVAQDEELVEEFDVDTIGRFFRIQERP